MAQAKKARDNVSTDDGKVQMIRYKGKMRILSSRAEACEEEIQTIKKTSRINMD